MLRLALCSVVAALALGDAAVADTGPKPTMAFAFSFDKPGLTIAGGVLLQCAKADCSDGQPLRQLGPQAFGCEPTACAARSYGFADFSQLQITFSDGRSLKSNVFKDGGMNARYDVRVEPADLKVQLH
jgi:hypothetical protein